MCSVLTRAARGSSAVIWPLPRHAAHAVGTLASSASARCLPCCVVLTAIASSSFATAVRQSVLTASRTTRPHGANTKRGGVRRLPSTTLRNNKSRGVRGSLRSQGAYGRSANSRRVWLRPCNTSLVVSTRHMHAMRVLGRARSPRVPRRGIRQKYQGLR